VAAALEWRPGPAARADERGTALRRTGLRLDLEQPRQVDRGGRQVGDGHGTDATQFLLVSIVSAGGIAKETEYSDFQVHYPDFWDAGARVKREFDIQIVAHRSVGYLDDQQNVFRARVADAVEIGAHPQHRDVRLDFGVLFQVDRILHCNDGAPPHSLDKVRGKVVDCPCVSAADRCHVDDLPLDQLDPGVGGEHPRLAHAVVVGYGQPMASVGVFGSRGHDITHEGSQVGLSSANRALSSSAGHYSSNSNEEQIGRNA